VPADPRHKPAEDAVREQLRDEEELVSSEKSAEPPAEAEAGEAEAGDAEADEAEAGDAEAATEEPEPAEVDDEEEEDKAAREPDDPAAVLQRERDEYLALAQRTQADFENWRKRAARESAAAGRRAKSGLVGELLPVVDNLERALDSAAEEDGLAGGVALVHSELVSVLVRNGVEPFDPKGETFDPSEHEALSTRPDEEAGNGVVLDVVEKGYRLNGSVLRPARVVVSG